MIKSTHALIINFLSLVMITGYYSILLDEVHAENFDLRKQIYQEEQPDLYGKQEFNVTVTMYNPTRGQTDTTPNELADGTKINPNKASQYRYVALSRDLIARWGGPFDYGDYVMIEGTGAYDGVYQVKDTMNARFINRVDILRTQGSKYFKYDNITLYKYFKYDQVTLHQHE